MPFSIYYNNTYIIIVLYDLYDIGTRYLLKQSIIYFIDIIFLEKITELMKKNEYPVVKLFIWEYYNDLKFKTSITDIHSMWGTLYTYN